MSIYFVNFFIRLPYILDTFYKNPVEWDKSLKMKVIGTFVLVLGLLSGRKDTIQQAGVGGLHSCRGAA
jgi:hypothetical protein